MNYYERHLGDYARDTAHLSLLEHGVYTILLDRYYATEMPIPADQAHRLARARTDDERAAVDAVLAEFFSKTEKGWVSHRVERELASARERMTQARENGRKGGRPPKNGQKKTGTKPEDNPNETQPFNSGSEIETGMKAHQAPSSHLSSKELLPTAGASAPAQPEPPPADPIFGTGLDFLLRKGLPNASARSFLGLLRKELRDDLTVAELLLEAERSDVSNPQAWLTQAAKQRKSQQVNGNANRSSGRKLSAVEQVEHEIAERHRRNDGAIEGTATRIPPG